MDPEGGYGGGVSIFHGDMIKDTNLLSLLLLLLLLFVISSTIAIFTLPPNIIPAFSPGGLGGQRDNGLLLLSRVQINFRINDRCNQKGLVG